MSPYIWLIAGAVFLVVELATLGLTTIWFMVGAIVAFFLNVLGLGLIWQMAAFIVVSGLMILAIRPFAAKKINNHTEKTNVESLIGQKAVVDEDINNIKGTGSAKVNGIEWSARSSKDSDVIIKGDVVMILRVEGVKLIVEKIQTDRDRQIHGEHQISGERIAGEFQSN